MIDRGSTWNIWDLHVHTPDSLVNNYKSNGTDDIWESYIKDLENLPEDIKVLGINDYLFIDGYRKVLDYKKLGRLQNIDLILPVLEFRLARFGGTDKLKRINYHVIFSDKISPDIIQTQFLNALNASYQLSEDNSWSGFVTKQSLIDFGNQIIMSSPNSQATNFETPLIEGFNNLNFEANLIKNVLEKSSYFKGEYLTAIGKTEWDRFSWNDNSIAEKKSLINKVDFIFTASENVDNYEKGKKKLKDNGVNYHLLDCSDAHRNTFDTSDSTNINRLGNCKTWIKSKTTFEGLKQVLFEFDSRVKIKDLRPEEKPAYYVLDSIRFDNPKFCNQEIFFNQNLNSIIGGRSTGKSTLLEIINAKVKNISANPYIAKILDSVTLNWKDNENSQNSDIDYFYQGYMHDLAENQKELDKLVREIVKSRENGIDLLDYENYCSSSAVDLIADMTRLFTVKTEANQKEQELKEKGSSLSINKEVALLEQKISDMSSSSFTEENLHSFEELCNTISLLENDSSKVYESEQICNHCKSQDIISSAISFEMEKIFSNSKNNELKNKYEIFKTETEQKWKDLLAEFESEFSNRKNSILNEIEQIKNDDLYKNGIAYKAKNKSYSELKDRIESEKTKLNSVIDTEKELFRLNEQITSISCKLIENHFALIDRGIKLIQSLNINKKDLKINAKLVLQKEELEEFLSSRINQQTLQNKEYVKNFCSIYEKEQSATEKIHTIDFLNRLLNKSISIKSGNEYQNIATEFFSRCWYTITYSITYQKDKFEEMSPGKQAFVVLKLLLDFSKKKCPILIDQPEDSLDNRAIFNELVEYIRQTKIERQIIIVTHNANIVVGSDSEEVIVANQHGKNSPNINSTKFQYLSGALEDTVIKHEADCILETQGIREHVCEILEGGKDAFEKRERKYGF